MPEALQYSENTVANSDGLKLYFRDYGSRLSKKTPVLCLAGLTRNSKDFDTLAMRICRSRRVISIDARGRGKSDYDPDYTNYSLIREASDALSILSTQVGKPAVIIGTSRGGLLSMIIHGVRADLIAGVVLNDIGPEIEMAGLQRISNYLGVEPMQLETLDHAVAALRKLHQKAFPKLSQAEWEEWARRSFKFEGNKVSLDYDPNLRRAFLETPAQGADFWPQFRRMSATPMVVLRGENSDLLSASTIEKMKRTKPDLRHVTVKDRGHVPFLDEPEVTEALDEFLAGIDASSA